MKKLVLKKNVEVVLMALVMGFVGFVTMTIESGLDNGLYIVGLVVGIIICYGIVKFLQKFSRSWE